MEQKNSRNEYKLRFDECEYEICGDVTKCTIKATLLVPYCDVLTKDIDVVGVGYAKPYGGDVYDELTGKRIARAKAENDAYASVASRIVDFVSKASPIIMNSLPFIEKLELYMSHNVEHVEELSR